MSVPMSFPIAEQLPDELELHLLVRDTEMIVELFQYDEGEPRDSFALTALRLGILALRQVRGHVDTEQLRREGEHLLERLHERLTEHARLVQERTAQTLREYFDPNSGRLHERLNRLLSQDGELEQLLRRKLGAQDSELSRTLSQYLGNESPLLKMLSPEDSRGILSAIRQAVEQQLAQQREIVLRQFSLDNKEGALARLLQELGEKNGLLAGQVQEQIAALMKQFSADEQGSALNRLLENVSRSTQLITREFSLNEEESSLARLRRELLKVLEEHRDQERRFQEEIKLAVQELAIRRQEQQRTTRQGATFEERLNELLAQETQRLGDVLETTGTKTGAIRYSKVGDAVITMGADSAAPGAKIVVEAKADASYNLNKILEEMTEARKNRRAQIGLFVWSRRHAPENMELLQRQGWDVIVVWDDEDPQTDLYVRLSLSVARALAIRERQREEHEHADWESLETAIQAIEQSINGLGTLENAAKQVGQHAEKMMKQLEKLRPELERQLQVLRDKTHALKTRQ
ncbi:MAG: hypothetical protein KatS3mg113_1017 [Planctomycetaceae bacterium]|nr:MAG: hypothetical protein KatS3mg113_1017 [Planctomycetaceae bacterium]